MKFNRLLTISILALTVALPTRAQSRDPFCVGFFELQNDRYDESINSFSQAIRSNPRLAEAYFYRGVAHYQQKRYPEALANYNQALKIGMAEPRIPLINRATTLAKIGDHRQAIEDLKLLLQISDRDYDYVYRAIAHSYYKLGNKSAAIAWLRKLESRYYSERAGSSYLRVRDAIKEMQAGRGNNYFGWWHIYSYDYARDRCR